jgi:malonate decarboxylase epsilon subunit
MSVAILFPGQGSQYAGMFVRFAGNPLAEATLDEASALLGYDIRSRGDEASLQSTINAQLALLASGVACARMLAGAGAEPDAVAGHSVGVFAAAVAAQSISFADAVRAVSERATLMESFFPSGYGMAVVVGLQERNVRTIVEAATARGEKLFISNVNAPLQLVLSGEARALESALAAATAAGANRTELLNVAVPSHCELLAPVEDRMHAVLSQIDVHAPRVPYIASVGARVIRDAASLRRDLAAGVAHEVRWYDATTTLVELGVTLLIEAAPGRVLSDLLEAAFPHVRCIALEETTTHSAALLAARMRNSI